MSRIKPLRIPASGFMPTKFDSAADKASALTRLTRWIIDGCQQAEFVRTDKPLYHTLYQHFGHIAHYNRHSFYETWFATPKAQLDFLRKHAAGVGIHGDPTYTWSDAQRYFMEWIRDSGILPIYEQRAAEYVEDANANLAKLALGNLSPGRRQQVIAQFSEVSA